MNGLAITKTQSPEQIAWDIRKQRESRELANELHYKLQHTFIREAIAQLHPALKQELAAKFVVACVEDKQDGRIHLQWLRNLMEGE